MEYRELQLQKEINQLDHFNRKENIASIFKEMEEREKRLFFFENEDDIDVQIEQKELAGIQGKTKSQIKRDKAIADRAYVPPEVHASRNK